MAKLSTIIKWVLRTPFLIALGLLLLISWIWNRAIEPTWDWMWEDE